MRDVYRSLLTLLAGILALWLILGFWPLSMGNRIVLSLLVVLVCGVVLWRQSVISHIRQNAVRNITNDNLPPEDFQGAVVLVCGDSASLFVTGSLYRESRQGWYLQVENAEQLPPLAHHLSIVRPALVSQISVLLALLPEHHLSADDFTQSLRGWRRAVTQCRTSLGSLPPVWTVAWVSPPGACAQGEPVWFTTLNHRSGMQVHQTGQGNLSLAEWISESDASGRFSRLSQALWFESLLNWQRDAMDALLTERAGELQTLRLCALGFCMASVSSQAGNLWQQHIADITALSPETTECSEMLPLPELLLTGLPRRRGISRRMQFWRYVGLLTGLFLGLAMLASFINNQRLIRSVDDHLTLYHRLTGEPPAPKLRAQQQLRVDAHLLGDWLRRGEPLRYRMGLYQGLRLIPPVEAAITDWAPPTPPLAKAAPHTVRLDSLSLFDTGQWRLKPGSTKVLVNALVGIKAKPGWLIVVAGHTDDVGDERANQQLSLKRAESVRDWMRDTGDVPESCFAVQGYGESRPAAPNTTTQGRALNRRVEISLVPQADACRLPDTPLPPSQDESGTQP
ncbi:OmpA family protein [Cronobacter turicensis]|nr:OmpA family protein [Cronobacter turicensis]EKY3213092.1 OmpA family protein [Cronobacter turicensis]EKY3216848.1 OmpA family protein [Cronobacter turicensis]